MKFEPVKASIPALCLVRIFNGLNGINGLYGFYGLYGFFMLSMQLIHGLNGLYGFYGLYGFFMLFMWLIHGLNGIFNGFYGLIDDKLLLPTTIHAFLPNDDVPSNSMCSKNLLRPTDQNRSKNKMCPTNLLCSPNPNEAYCEPETYYVQKTQCVPQTECVQMTECVPQKTCELQTTYVPKCMCCDSGMGSMGGSSMGSMPMAKKYMRKFLRHRRSAFMNRKMNNNFNSTNMRKFANLKTKFINNRKMRCFC
uniref:Uncharacterized protein n=1 Tax=Acrobeloides nanus TaxID=290746 RepID=A0A914E488_9BILA